MQSGMASTLAEAKVVWAFEIEGLLGIPAGSALQSYVCEDLYLLQGLFVQHDSTHAVAPIMFLAPGLQSVCRLSRTQVPCLAGVTADRSQLRTCRSSAPTHTGLHDVEFSMMEDMLYLFASMAGSIAVQLAGSNAQIIFGSDKVASSLIRTCWPHLTEIFCDLWPACASRGCPQIRQSIWPHMEIFSTAPADVCLTRYVCADRSQPRLPLRPLKFVSLACLRVGWNAATLRPLHACMAMWACAACMAPLEARRLISRPFPSLPGAANVVSAVLRILHRRLGSVAPRIYARRSRIIWVRVQCTTVASSRQPATMQEEGAWSFDG